MGTMGPMGPMEYGAMMMCSYDVPSGELTFCYGKSSFLIGISTISMAIFHCYVSSPEGT